MTKDSEDIDNLIDSFKSFMFRRIRCPKMDALTVFVPKGQKTSLEVQKVLDEAGPQRWFPKDNGYLVKCPYVFDSYDEKLFKLEKDGWDHEHCDKCGDVINSEDVCWAAERDDSLYIFCDNCYQKL